MTCNQLIVVPSMPHSCCLVALLLLLLLFLPQKLPRRSHGPRPRVTCTYPLRSRPSRKCLDSLCVFLHEDSLQHPFGHCAIEFHECTSSLRHRHPHRYAVSLVAISQPVVCISGLLKFATLVPLRSTCSTTPSAHTALEPFSGATVEAWD